MCCGIGMSFWCVAVGVMYHEVGMLFWCVAVRFHVLWDRYVVLVCSSGGNVL